MVSPLLFLMITPILEGQPSFEVAPSTLTLYIPKGEGLHPSFKEDCLSQKVLEASMKS